MWENTQDLKNLLTWLPDAQSASPPDYSRVERIVLHDQGCLNPERCTENATQYPVATVQNIFRFHSVTRGWGDIGYNYIIDRQGRIFEGRFGGNGSRGAHLYKDATCQNFNIGSAGILLLGDLRAGSMTEAQANSLARLAVWLGVANGFDPAAMNVTTSVWQNLKKASGSCDLSSGSFNSSFVGPTVASHGDIEPGNSDTFDMSPTRTAATPYVGTFAAMLYRAEGMNGIFAIQDGVLQERAAASTATAASLELAQLTLFPRATLSSLPDGSLVKSFTRSRVYKIESGVRRAVPTADLFVASGFSWATIQEVSDRELSLWRIGNPLPYPDGTLVKGSGEKVYMFESGKLRHITSASLFAVLRYAWTAITSLLDTDLSAYATANPMLYPTGSLVKGTAPTVYFLENGLRKPISSAALFLAQGFRWGDIKALSDQELSQYYPQGQYVKWPDGTLIRPEGQSAVYLVQKGYRRWIQTPDAFLALKLRWEAIYQITLAELAAYSEAQPIGSVADASQEPVLAGEQQQQNQTTQETTNNQQTNTNTTALEPTVRIGLAVIGSGTLVEVSSDVSYSVKKNGAAVVGQPAGTSYSVTPQSGEVWRFEPEGEGIATISPYTDPAWNGSNDNRFRGIIELKQDSAGSFWFINELPIESYLKGIAETINGEHPEYAKAFAIATRSYAYHYIQKGGKRAGEPFHIRRTTADQWYKGYNFELRAKDPVAAVVATRGMVAMYNGTPVLSAYSSGAPGPTLNACTLWGGKFCESAYQYLKGGVGDPEGTIYKYTACGGAVHCIGLDAAGARRMAQLGSPAATILTTYYPGTAIQGLWE